jgi:cytidylate kinase
VICIAKIGGSQGEEVGRLVAERLGYRLVDEEIIARAAQKEGVSPEMLADVERRRSFLTRLLTELGRSGYGDLYMSTDLTVPTDDALRGRIREAITETAAEGSVVIVAHAASYALEGSGDVLRVFVTASPAVHAARLVPDDDGKRGAKAVADDDAGRAQYLKRFYGVGQEQPADYDLVVSTDSLTAERVADLVVSAAA